MIEILRFYIGLVVQIFERVLNGFEVTSGVGFGTFLLASSLIVVFISLLKFQLVSNGFDVIKSSRNKNASMRALRDNSKHTHSNIGVYHPKHSRNRG